MRHVSDAPVIHCNHFVGALRRTHANRNILTDASFRWEEDLGFWGCPEGLVSEVSVDYAASSHQFQVFIGDILKITTDVVWLRF